MPGLDVLDKMTGRKRTVTNKEILETLSAISEPFLTTTEVADELDFSQPGALRRLRELEELNLVGTKKAGNSNTWWITDRGRAYLDGEIDKEEVEAGGQN